MSHKSNSTGILITAVFFLKFFCRTYSHVLFWGHWYLCFGFLVTSPLGFKAKVDSALFTLWRRSTVLHGQHCGTSIGFIESSVADPENSNDSRGLGCGQEISNVKCCARWPSFIIVCLQGNGGMPPPPLPRSATEDRAHFVDLAAGIYIGRRYTSSLPICAVPRRFRLIFSNLLKA